MTTGNVACWSLRDKVRISKKSNCIKHGALAQAALPYAVFRHTRIAGIVAHSGMWLYIRV